MLKTYSKALDHILSAVASAHAGKPKTAAKHIAQAMEQDDFEQTMDVLNDQQQDMMDQQDPGMGVDDLGFDQEQQQSFSRALARVTANTKKVKRVTAAEKDEDDDSAMEEDAGSGMFDNEGSDAESVKIEHASAGDDSDDDSDDDSEKDEEAKVMASARNRLARTTRAKANAQAMAKLSKQARRK